jgi:hypothetical protein
MMLIVLLSVGQCFLQSAVRLVYEPLTVFECIYFHMEEKSANINKILSVGNA